MRNTRVLALIAAATLVLGCTDWMSVEGECVVEPDGLDVWISPCPDWPCEIPNEPVLGQGAPVLYPTFWLLSPCNDPFCPEGPRAVSSDEGVLVAEIAGECGSEVRLTGVAPGIAHVDLLDGETVVGSLEKEVAEIGHLSIAPRDVGVRARQDPPFLSAAVGEPLLLIPYAYDGEGRLVDVPREAAVWSSDTPSVIELVDPTTGTFAVHAAGSSFVSVELAGLAAGVTVVASEP